MAKPGLLAKINNEALARNLAKLVSDMAPAFNEASRAICEEGAEYARKLYASAEYDGEHDAVVTVEPLKAGGYGVVARGVSVPFIEYGTGTDSNMSGSKKREQWIFAAKGRQIRLTAGGELLENKYRAYYKGPRSKKRHYINLEYQKKIGNITTGKKGELRMRGTGIGQREWVDKKGIVHVKETKIQTFKINLIERKTPRKNQTHLKDKYYYTEGNPPQDIMMVHTRKYMASVAKKVVAEYAGKI